MTLAQTEIPELVASKHMTGLFKADYIVGKPMPGARLLKLGLMVYTPAETITGIANITQAVNPPVDLKFRVQGSFTYMALMKGPTRILVVLSGHPAVKWPPHGGVGPVIPETLELRMVLEEDWKSGVANYKYVDEHGEWKEVENAPVALAK